MPFIIIPATPILILWFCHLVWYIVTYKKRHPNQSVKEYFIPCYVESVKGIYKAILYDTVIGIATTEVKAYALLQQRILSL